MIRLTRARPGSGAAARAEPSVRLRYEQRIKSRLRVRLDDGTEAGLFLERGTTLADGDLLVGDDGRLVRVVAATETLSCATAADPLLLARACYHLGNRHVAVQIEPRRLCYLHDHVLDAMLRRLGLEVGVEQAPFEPEPGAYGGSHAGGHDHPPAHGDHGH